MAASSLVALLQSVPDGLISLGVGLVGVALARWVFVNRQNRRQRKKESWKETLPLTLVAMLITGVLVWDRRLGVSASAFAGLGVGWVAVLLLDVVGDKILLAFGGTPIAASHFDHPGPGRLRPETLDTPDDLGEMVYKLDQEEG